MTKVEMLCIYCQQENGTCGAKEYEEPLPKFARPMQFAYNGFIVWPLVNYAEDTREFVFYKGHDVIGEVKVTRQLLIQEVAEGEDYMPFIWEHFEEEKQ